MSVTELMKPWMWYDRMIQVKTVFILSQNSLGWTGENCGKKPQHNRSSYLQLGCKSGAPRKWVSHVTVEPTCLVKLLNFSKLQYDILQGYRMQFYVDWPLLIIYWFVRNISKNALFSTCSKLGLFCCLTLQVWSTLILY